MEVLEEINQITHNSEGHDGLLLERRLPIKLFALVLCLVLVFFFILLQKILFSHYVRLVYPFVDLRNVPHLLLTMLTIMPIKNGMTLIFFKRWVRWSSFKVVWQLIRVIGFIGLTSEKEFLLIISTMVIRIQFSVLNICPTDDNFIYPARNRCFYDLIVSHRLNEHIIGLNDMSTWRRLMDFLLNYLSEIVFDWQNWKILIMRIILEQICLFVKETL